MPASSFHEPGEKCTVAFFDGQNLFHEAKRVYGYSYPNFDPIKLAQCLCARSGWTLSQARFYSGIPKPQYDPVWAGFWQRKLARMGSRGVVNRTLPLRYIQQPEATIDGETYPARMVGHEKGVDVRIALDIIRLAFDQKYDVALVFSQDQDLSAVAEEIRVMAERQQRWIKMASAFPQESRNQGIRATDWVRFTKQEYDGCIDPADYR